MLCRAMDSCLRVKPLLIPRPKVLAEIDGEAYEYEAYSPLREASSSSLYREVRNRNVETLRFYTIML